MGVSRGDMDSSSVREQDKAGRARMGVPCQAVRMLTPGPPISSFEWPREPLVPLYVPKFHSGWEPPLDVLQDAPWEVEAPENEVSAPTAPALLPAPPHVPALTAPLEPALPRQAPRSFLPTADPSKPAILSKLPQTQPGI